MKNILEGSPKPNIAVTGVSIYYACLVIGFFLFFFLELSCNLMEREDTTHLPTKKKLVILSIDGFPGYYLTSDSKFKNFTPNLNKLITKSNFSNKVNSTYPTLTYPAHTSMLTGTDPIEHGIIYNSPVDPFRKYQGGWMWYDEDIKVKTILDFAKEKGMKTASLYWPVTVGADIDYNLPQYWRTKTEEDEKLLKAISTKNLYKELQKESGHSVLETTGDTEKIETAISLWKLKKPDVFLIYSTDLDSVHHEKGVFSESAGEKLKKIDSLVGKLIKKLNIYEDPNLGFIIVSDHGFKEVKAVCAPNKILLSLGVIDQKNSKWKYFFKTLGGIAILVENKDKDSLSASLDIEDLKNKISLECPFALLDTEEELKQVKEKLNKSTKAILHSKVNMAFSESLTIAETYRENMSYYNHGFLPSDSEMKTISIVYPKSNPVKIEDLKDTFEASCNWLGLNCKRGANRK
ncbi:MAG: alkaline phosphatase family protein [Leptospiraceae bacterium]|nr:alkaline phosphatase family protein [Leptospiraceae bacterium]